MMSQTIRLGASLLVGLAVAIVISPLEAQPPVQVQGQQQSALPLYQPPQPPPQPQPKTQGTAQLTTTQPSFAPFPQQNAGFYNGVAVPVGGYLPYRDPYGGYLTGQANLVTASGNFMQSVQQSALMQEDVKRSQINTRQAIIQQRMYEDSITPKTEDVRMQQELNRLRHSRNDPPQSDIWSADALNTLFTAIKSAQVAGIRGPTIPLPEDMLRHINLSTGKRPANIGVLRDGGRLDWPLILQDDTFKKDRERLNELTQQAVKEAATTGRVDSKIIRELNPTVDRMQQNLLRMVQEAPPDQYMEGRRFLRDLAAAYKLFQDPDVGNYFGRWVPQGRTVGELLQHMIDNGLQFAPALPGDETFYTAFYNNLLKYDTGISQLVSHP
jgi:hypothetical protein